MTKYAKFPMERPITGRKVLVKFGLGSVLEGVAVYGRSSGVCIMINGKRYDSNNTLYWRYPQAD